MSLRIGPFGPVLSFLLCLFALAAQAEVTLKIVLDRDNVTYRVYMNSSVSYTGTQAAISTSQITLSVPHGLGPDRFTPTNLQSPIPGMQWQYTGRAAAPAENPDRDYLFFSFINNQFPLARFDIVAGQDYLLFTFKRQGNCIGSAQLLDNETDEFKVPNSLGINVGNQLSILGAAGNVYKTNNDSPPSLSIAVSSALVCTGESVTLTAVPSKPPASATATYSYQWFADGQSLGPVQSSPVLTYLPPAKATPNYTVQLRVKLFIKGPTTCQGQFVGATQAIEVRSRPSAILTYSGDPCTPLPVALAANPVSGATYQWLLNDVPIAGEVSSTHSATVSGTYAIQLEQNGCTATSSPQTIFGQAVAEKIEVKLPSALSVVEGQSVRLTPTVANAVSYSWVHATGLSSATVAAPVARPSQTTSYTVTAYGSTGCPASATVLVNVIPTLRIPTAFSPNGDLVNDRWEIYNLEHHPGTSLTVYDRWGNVVFSASEANPTPWDGQRNGEPQATGTYQYVVRSPYQAYTGTLTLLR